MCDQITRGSLHGLRHLRDQSPAAGAASSMLLSPKPPCRHRGKVVRPCFASKELLSAGTPQQQRLARPARAAHAQRLSAVYSSCATLRRSHVHHLMLPLGGHPVSSRLPAAGESAEGASAAADERSKKHNAAVAVRPARLGTDALTRT